MPEIDFVYSLISYPSLSERRIVTSETFARPGGKIILPVLKRPSPLSSNEITFPIGNPPGKVPPREEVTNSRFPQLLFRCHEEHREQDP